MLSFSPLDLGRMPDPCRVLWRLPTGQARASVITELTVQLAEIKKTKKHGREE